MGTCGPFIKQRLLSTITRNASCPFNKDLCLDQDRNLKLETVMNTHSDLGLNAPSNSRLTTKFITYCAPLRRAGYEKVHNVSGRTFIRYYYGSWSETRGNKTSNDYAFECEQLPSNRLAVENAGNSTTPIPDYSIT